MKLAVISSANEIISQSNRETVLRIAEYLQKLGSVEIMTGGSHGIPGLMVEKAKELGMKTTAYSPDEDRDLHASRHDNQSLEYFDEVKHHKGFTLRSLVMLQDADAILALNGRMGTLSELTIALEEEKRVGIVTNTGGIADELRHIIEITKKDYADRVFFSDDYIKVINWLIAG